MQPAPWLAIKNLSLLTLLNWLGKYVHDLWVCAHNLIIIQPGPKNKFLVGLSGTGFYYLIFGLYKGMSKWISGEDWIKCATVVKFGVVAGHRGPRNWKRNNIVWRVERSYLAPEECQSLGGSIGNNNKVFLASYCEHFSCQGNETITIICSCAGRKIAGPDSSAGAAMWVSLFFTSPRALAHSLLQHFYAAAKSVYKREWIHPEW